MSRKLVSQKDFFCIKLYEWTEAKWRRKRIYIWIAWLYFKESFRTRPPSFGMLFYWKAFHRRTGAKAQTSADGLGHHFCLHWNSDERGQPALPRMISRNGRRTERSRLPLTVKREASGIPQWFNLCGKASKLPGNNFVLCHLKSSFVVIAFFS